ncbi:MAG TPA: hypothetical protein VN841_29215 [Bryobacteraceae bacterium]|nr:hypothetical protein [Bryobacteraceae bacterium]
MGQEQIAFEIDPRSVVGALAQMNKAVEGFEKGSAGANERLQGSFERVSNLLLKMNDKSRNSMESLTKSIEKQAVAYGRTGVDKLIAQRDQYIKRLGSEKDMIDRVTAAYDKMIKTEEGGGAGRFKQIGAGIADFIERPAQAAQGALGGMLEKLGPVGGVLAGAAVAGTAFAAAGYEMAKSLGETGVQIRDMQLRTGLTTKEVGQFQYAARATGAEVGIFERMMRGLTNAVTEDSAEALKARSILTGFGVDVRAVREGLAPTSEVLLQISDGLNKMPNEWERNRAALDLFKKVGIEAVPTLIELRENIEHAREAGFGFGEDQVKQMIEVNRQVADVETRWKQLRTEMEKPVAAAFEFVVNGQSDFSKVMEFFPALGGMALSGRPGAPVPELGATSGLAQQIQAQRHGTLAGMISGDERAFGGTEAGLHELLSSAEKTAKTSREAYFGMKDDATATYEAVTKARDAWRQAEQAVAGYKARIDALGEGFKLEKNWMDAGTLIGKPASPYAGAGTSGRVPSLMGGSSALQITGADIAAANRGSDLAQSAVDKARFEGQIGLYKVQDERSEQLTREIAGYWEEVARLTSGPGGELETAQKIYEIRISTAKTVQEQQLAGIEYLKQEASIVAENAKKMADEQEKQQKQQMESISRPAEGLFHTLFTNPRSFGSHLQSTLRDSMLKPVEAGLGGLAARTLQPLVYGADGQGGIAGMFRGVFGGQKEVNPLVPLHQETNWRLAAITSLLAAGMGVAAPSASSFSIQGAGAVPSIFSMAGGGGGAASIPTGLGLSMGGFGGGGGAFPSGGGGISPLASILGPGGTPGFAPGGVFGGGTSSGGIGGGGLLKGLGGSWSGLKGALGIGGHQLPGPTLPGQGPLMSGTSFSSIAGSPLAGAAGMMAAQWGLLGSGRGTWGGIAGGTVGGALVGMEFGGPLGAAIGAAAGFGIGLGEKLAGVETPENQAKRLARQVYNISIDNQMARQIVSISKEKYGNTMSVAIRSPEVRQMMGLYAAGTGQSSRFPQSAATPHGASLVESGGSLYQSATYQYGNPYTMQSNLPTLGPSGGSWPNPSSPTYVSLNIGSQDAAGFMTGSYVTPGFVQSQFATAQEASNGRVNNSASMQGQPALIVA